jgi:AraC-like DNA-binding protein
VKISALMLSKPVLPDLNTISFNLNMATRTFQRKLTKEGSSYREISEELRRKISLLLLRHDFSVSDISTILGYSEPASYIHSFVKWHGKSPSEVRNHLVDKI